MGKKSFKATSFIEFSLRYMTNKDPQKTAEKFFVSDAHV